MSISTRIPDQLDNGTHHDTCITTLEYHYKAFMKGDSELVSKADRYVCGYPVPNFQRPLCWSVEQKVRFIESVYLGLPIGTFTINKMEWDANGEPSEFSGILLDGQQRLSTIEEYLNDGFQVFGLMWSELNRREKGRFLRAKFGYFEVSLKTEQELRELYNRLALGGTPHTEADRA